MAWVAGDRPGDVIRVVAGLQLYDDGEDWIERLGPLLGLTRMVDTTAVNEESSSSTASSPPRRTAGFLRVLRRPTALRAAAGIFAVLFVAVGLVITSPWIVAVVCVVFGVLIALFVLRARLRGLLSRVIPLTPRSVLEPDFDLEVFREPPPPVQLVPDYELRSVVHALSCVVRPSSRPDLRRAVKDISLGRSALPLQRLRATRLARRLEILIDRADPMSPLAADVEALVEQMHHVVGGDRIKVLSFRTVPEDGVGDGPLWTWIPYSTTPASDGTRIVILSDAGAGLTSLGHRADVARHWNALTEALASGSTPAILLTPFAADSYSSPFDELLSIATWNESLTARGILQKIRSGT